MNKLKLRETGYRVQTNKALVDVAVAVSGNFNRREYDVNSTARGLFGRASSWEDFVDHTSVWRETVFGFDRMNDISNGLDVRQHTAQPRRPRHERAGISWRRR